MVKNLNMKMRFGLSGISLKYSPGSKVKKLNCRKINSYFLLINALIAMLGFLKSLCLKFFDFCNVIVILTDMI